MKGPLRARYERVRPLEEMEGAVVRARVDRPDWLSDADYARLRYALNLARVEVVPAPDGDVDLDGALDAYRARVTEVLEPLVRTPTGAIRLHEVGSMMPTLAAITEETRAELLTRFAGRLDAEHLDREVCHKALVVVAGGGGGAGYVYGGAYLQLDEIGLVPRLLVGTSMGSIMSLFRAHRREFDLDEMMRVARGMRWNTVFSLPHVRNKYGLPATLRLYLRRTLADFFRHDSGRVLRMNELEIPLRVVVTGVGAGALAHDIAWYEHLADDVAQRGKRALPIRLIRRQMVTLVGALREFARRRAQLKEVVIGGDALTEAFDVLDAVGFSAAVPGLIHYDVWRKDPHMHDLLEAVLEAYGVVRLMDGGVVNNVPARVAWSHAQRGDLGTRNAFVLALDAFAPQLSRNLVALPVQRMVRPQVEHNLRFANHAVSFRRVLSPMDLVPSAEKIEHAMRNGYEEMRPERAFMRAVMAPIPRLF